MLALAFTPLPSIVPIIWALLGAHWYVNPWVSFISIITFYYCLYYFGFRMENSAHTHARMHSDRDLEKEEKRETERNELLIMLSNYGVWSWERYDPREISSNSHLSQQIEWKTVVRGAERSEKTGEKERGQGRSRDKRPTLCYQTLLLKYAKELRG